jgi:hypothetical protein
LHQRIAQVCETATPVDQDTSTDTKRRSRDETRVVEVFDPDAALAGTEWADHVGAIVRVSRTTHKRVTATGLWDTSIEVAYFVCEFLLPAATCAHAIRHRWGIENSAGGSRARAVILRRERQRLAARWRDRRDGDRRGSQGSCRARRCWSACPHRPRPGRAPGDVAGPMMVKGHGACLDKSARRESGET